MMAPTHMLAGALIALPFMVRSPELSAIAVGAGLLGGFFPDLDMYRGHRRTLHFPVYFVVAGIGITLVAAVFPNLVTVGLATGCLAAGLHSVMDIFGGGLELRPWQATSNRAVYSHYHRKWLPPRRWIPYDGSPADLALALLLTLVLLRYMTGYLAVVLLIVLGVGIVYAIFRKTLTRIAIVLIARLPLRVHPYLPSRYLTVQ